MNHLTFHNFQNYIPLNLSHENLAGFSSNDDNFSAPQKLYWEWDSNPEGYTWVYTI